MPGRLRRKLFSIYSRSLLRDCPTFRLDGQWDALPDPISSCRKDESSLEWLVFNKDHSEMACHATKRSNFHMEAFDLLILLFFFF